MLAKLIKKYILLQEKIVGGDFMVGKAVVKEWLKTNEVAEALDVRVETVRRWIREGRVQAKKFGGRWFIHKSVLENGKGKNVEKE